MPRNWMSSSKIALIALVCVTAIWGWTFVVVQDAISLMPVMDFLGWRFGIAALVMFLLRPTCLKSFNRQGIMRGIILGIFVGLGYTFQTFGLLYTTAAVSGFITGMFVVLTPVIAWLLLRRSTNAVTWFSVALAAVGLGLMSLNSWSMGLGEILTLICAVAYAVHVVGLGEWSSKYETYGLTVIQLGTVAVLSLIIGTADGGLVVPPAPSVWFAVVVTAILATAVAYFVQTWAQSLVSPTRAAVVMTMEPVFTGIFAVMLIGNQITPRVLAGGICIIAAMYVVQLKASASTSDSKA